MRAADLLGVLREALEVRLLCSGVSLGVSCREHLSSCKYHTELLNYLKVQKVLSNFQGISNM